MAPRRHNDDIVMIGLNRSAAGEAEALRRLGNHVVLIGAGQKPPPVRLGRVRLDITNAADARVLFARLGVRAEALENLARLLSNSTGGIRTELAQLAFLWARLGRGLVAASRLVISGHHAGGGLFWGDGRSTLSSRDISALAAIFPDAALAVEDLHLSACYSGGNILDWPPIFKNLLTIWAYSGSAPGSFSGAALHLRLWDRATKGTAPMIDRLKAADTRKGSNVAVWSRAYGLQTAVVEDIETVRHRIQAAETTFRSYFEGQQLVVDTERGPLREYYNDLQSALQHPDLQPSERQGLEKRREVTVRLIHYEKAIKVRFAAHYARQISQGYAAVQLASPQYSEITRKQAFDEITAFVLCHPPG